MSTPKTLLQMAGADAGPASLATSTLVIIDAQNEYLDGKLALPGVKPATEALARLLAKARAAGAPVVHVVQKGRPGGLFDLEARGGAVIDAVKQAAGEHTVQKPLPNAFAQTDLDATLKKLGRTSLVIAGFMTHMCVSSTARAALDLGYKTTVAARRRRDARPARSHRRRRDRRRCAASHRAGRAGRPLRRRGDGGSDSGDVMHEHSLSARIADLSAIPSAWGEGWGEGRLHTPAAEFSAAPHPNPLPASGERGPARRPSGCDQNAGRIIHA